VNFSDSAHYYYYYYTSFSLAIGLLRMAQPYSVVDDYTHQQA